MCLPKGHNVKWLQATWAGHLAGGLAQWECICLTHRKSLVSAPALGQGGHQSVLFLLWAPLCSSEASIETSSYTSGKWSMWTSPMALLALSPAWFRGRQLHRDQSGLGSQIQRTLSKPFKGPTDAFSPGDDGQEEHPHLGPWAKAYRVLYWEACLLSPCPPSPPPLSLLPPPLCLILRQKEWT